QVQLEDRVLGEVALDLDCDTRFLQLARELLLAADLVREDVAGELHADRREALRIAEREQVRLKGAEHPQIIYAVVRVETLVLGGEERLPHGDRNLGKRQDRATFQAELADQAAIGGEDLRRLHLHVLAGPDQARDAGAMLAGADAGPRAV